MLKKDMLVVTFSIFMACIFFLIASMVIVEIRWEQQPQIEAQNSENEATCPRMLGYQQQISIRSVPIRTQQKFFSTTAHRPNCCFCKNYIYTACGQL